MRALLKSFLMINYLIDVNFFCSFKEKLLDYLHAIDVWIVSKSKAIGDYHDLYLKTDALLLPDAFENFISGCFAHYGLDPCYPWQSWIKL